MKRLALALLLLTVPAVALADFTHFSMWRVDEFTGIEWVASALPGDDSDFIVGMDGTTAEGIVLLPGDGIVMDSGELSVDWDAAPAPAAPSFTSTTHAIGSCFQVSASKPALVNYSVTLSGVLTLTSASVFLESFTDSGCTTGTVELSRVTSGGLAVNPSAAGGLSGWLAPGLYAKLRSSGTATFTVNSGWETQF